MAAATTTCRIVGKPLNWEDTDEHASYFQADSMLTHLLDLAAQIDYLRTTITQRTLTPQLVGVSNGFKQAHELILKASRTDVTVLLLGETGVGEERLRARLASGRRAPPRPLCCGQLCSDAA